MVDIREFCQIIGQDIDMKFFHKRQVWSAKIRNVEIMRDGMLVGAHEESQNDPEEAVISYMRRIARQRIVINAHTDKKQEINVPNLSYKGRG